MPKFHLVLSGSGARFPAFLGVLNYASKHVYPCMMSQLAMLLGSSGGAAVCLLIALGYHLSFLERLSFRLEYNDLRSLDIACLLTDFGIDTGYKFERLFKTLIKHKLGNALATFADLWAARHIDLRITGTNITQRKLEVFSKDTTPDMPLWLAVRISTSLPLVFTSPKWHEDHYTDGALLASFPIHLLPQDQIGVDDTVLAVNLVYPRSALQPLSDLPSFLTGLMSTMFAAINCNPTSLDPRYECLTITTQSFVQFKLDVSRDAVKELIMEGYHAAQHHFADNAFISRWVKRIFNKVLAAGVS